MPELDVDTIRRSLTCHRDVVFCICWSPDGQRIASGGRDRTVYVSDVATGRTVAQLRGHTDFVNSLAWSPDGRFLASASRDQTIRVWNLSAGEGTFQAYSPNQGSVTAIAWSPDGTRICAGTNLGYAFTIGISQGIFSHTQPLVVARGVVTAVSWSPTGHRLLVCAEDTSRIYDGQNPAPFQLLAFLPGTFSAAWTPSGHQVATSGQDWTIRIWDPITQREVALLEGHSGRVAKTAFTADGRFLVSKSQDSTVRFWRCDLWDEVYRFGEALTSVTGAIAVHPVHSSVIATAGRMEKEVLIRDIDTARLMSVAMSQSTVQYRNAKVVVVGEQGVGKTGLCLVLLGNPFSPTDSTHGRKVHIFASETIPVDGAATELREIFLWDLAGQPDYRLIHQLHLDQAALALVVIDDRADIDPFMRAKYWDRALSQASRARGSGAIPTKKLLVAARVDRGGVAAAPRRIADFLQEHHFADYIATSARDGIGIAELRSKISTLLDWSTLPKISSNQLFQDVREYVISTSKSGRLLVNGDALYSEVINNVRGRGRKVPGKDEYWACLQQIESRGLIRRLSFHNLILLQPAYLDAYASAVANAAKEEPFGMGFVPEALVREAKFQMAPEERAADQSDEKLLVIATVEELLLREIVLRHQLDDKSILIFPSQLTRENPDIPETKGKTVSFRFKGPIQNIYATLVVRLAHCGLFRENDLWRNAVIFSNDGRNLCGIILRDFGEGSGEVSIFYPSASGEHREKFAEYVRAHLLERSVAESLTEHPVIACHECEIEFSDAQVQARRARGGNSIICSACGAENPLPGSHQIFDLKRSTSVRELNVTADQQRNREANISVGSGLMDSNEFMRWLSGNAAAERVSLALAITDIVGSTSLALDKGDAEMEKMRELHFAKTRHYIRQFDGYEIKTMGDGFMIAFRNVEQAFQFCKSVSFDTGHDLIHVRAAMHCGLVTRKGTDIFGTMVNLTSRICGYFSEAQIGLSDQAKQELDSLWGRDQKRVRWIIHERVMLKDFPERTLWTYEDR